MMAVHDDSHVRAVPLQFLHRHGEIVCRPDNPQWTQNAMPIAIGLIQQQQVFHQQVLDRLTRF